MVSRGLVTMEGTLLEYVGSFNMVDIINKHIKRTKETSDDFKDTVKELLVAVNGASRGALRAAEYAGDTMQLLSRGQLKVNMEMLGSAEPMMKISRILNRLTIGLIIAGLLISAALLTFAIDESHIFGLSLIHILKDGSCGSIGYGIATAYAKEGANLVITGRNVQKLEDAKEELERLYGIKVLPIQADVSAGNDNAATVQNVIDKTIEEFGRIDVPVSYTHLRKEAQSNAQASDPTSKPPNDAASHS